MPRAILNTASLNNGTDHAGLGKADPYTTKSQPDPAAYPPTSRSKHHMLAIMRICTETTAKLIYIK